MLHANSPMSCAPTMRPLPFSVWNERRVDDQCFGVRSIGGPHGKVALDARDLFLGLFDEHLDELGIRAALLDLHHARRRCSGLRLRGRRARRGRLRPPRHGRRRLRHGQGFKRSRQRSALSSMYQGSATAGADRLHVVLDADDRVGEPFEVLGLELRADGEPRADHGRRFARRPSRPSSCRASTSPAVMPRSCGFACSSGRVSAGFSTSWMTASFTRRDSRCTRP